MLTKEEFVSQDQQSAAFGLHRQTGTNDHIPVKQPNTAVRQVDIEDIERDEGLQARVQLDQDTIDSYAEDMQHGAEFPPIVLFQEDAEDGTRYWPGDGWHRFEAAVRIGVKNIRATVHHGSRRDALIHAAGANASNGLRRTNSDKRKAVEMLLRDDELVRRSDRDIGKLAGVDHKTVANVRTALETCGEIPQIEEKEVTRKGKPYTQRGKRKATTSRPKSEKQDNKGPQEQPSQTYDVEDAHDGNPQPGPGAPSASDSQSEPDQHTGIQAVQYDDQEPQESDDSCQPEPESLPLDTLLTIQAAQDPHTALYALVNMFAGHVNNFRAHYTWDMPVVEEALVTLEGTFQSVRYKLEDITCNVEYDVEDLGGDDTDTVEQDEPTEFDGQVPLADTSSSEASSATTESVDAGAVVNEFVAKRCIPSTEPESGDAVMAAINTWLANKGQPPLTETDVCRELYRLGFKGGSFGARDGIKVNTVWLWKDVQLLPADAPDNAVNPFGASSQCTNGNIS